MPFGDCALRELISLSFNVCLSINASSSPIRLELKKDSGAKKIKTGQRRTVIENGTKALVREKIPCMRAAPAKRRPTEKYEIRYSMCSSIAFNAK